MTLIEPLYEYNFQINLSLFTKGKFPVEVNSAVLKNALENPVRADFSDFSVLAFSLV